MKTKIRNLMLKFEKSSPSKLTIQNKEVSSMISPSFSLLEEKSTSKDIPIEHKIMLKEKMSDHQKKKNPSQVLEKIQKKLERKKN